jgi:lysophospholipase L1-like esterase
LGGVGCMSYKNYAFTAVLVFISIIFSVGIGEVFLRLKNANMRNYDIEMWRYSKELKRKSDNSILGHEHIPSKESVLQSVNIRVNKEGLRGDDVKPRQAGVKRVLFIGSSITLGWGVAEDETLTNRLNQMLKKGDESVEVLNGGIGNYNTVRYVERFLTNLTHLNPDVIVVQYFINDAEVLTFTDGNWALKNSQLAVTLWTAYNRFFRATGEDALSNHYDSVYKPDAKGFRDMKVALKQLADYAGDKNIKVLIAMTPDFHNLKGYPFDFIHQKISQISNDFGFEYVDLLPAFDGLNAMTLWSMPGDPHPNSLGHELMANRLYPYVKKSLESN